MPYQHDVSCVLSGHVSPETAYLIHSYPFGSGLRCLKRCWIETKPKFGQRFCFQTTKRDFNRRYTDGMNMEKDEVYLQNNMLWNASKYLTYADMVIMYLDSDKHVQNAHLSMYTSAEEKENLRSTFYDKLSPEEQQRFDRFCGQ